VSGVSTWSPSMSEAVWNLLGAAAERTGAEKNRTLQRGSIRSRPLRIISKRADLDVPEEEEETSGVSCLDTSLPSTVRGLAAKNPAAIKGEETKDPG